MWASIKRLSLGFALIIAASAVLLFSDVSRRQSDRARSGGAKVLYYRAGDDIDEAEFIARSARTALHDDPENTVAILYRTNSQSRQIEEALRRYGRKYNVVGGFSFYQRAEIRDTLAYLKLAASNAHSVSLMRIINTPARGIGRTTVEQIEQYGREHGLNLWESIERIIDAYSK